MTTKTTKPASQKSTDAATPAAPSTSAEVLAQGWEQSASQAATSEPGAFLQGEDKTLSPEGSAAIPTLVPTSIAQVVLDAQAARPDEPIVTHLLVRSLAPGFRRAGRAWPAEEVEVSVDDFTVDQVNALLREPMLVVTPMVMGMGESAEAGK